MSLDKILSGISISREDIEQDNAGGKTIIKLDKDTFDWVEKSLLESENKDWVLSVKKGKGKISVSSKWETVFQRK